MKLVMALILIAMVVPAAIALVLGWKKACKEARERRNNDG
jgi:hypothetical protein